MDLAPDFGEEDYWKACHYYWIFYPVSTIRSGAAVGNGVIGD